MKLIKSITDSTFYININMEVAIFLERVGNLRKKKRSANYRSSLVKTEEQLFSLWFLKNKKIKNGPEFISVCRGPGFESCPGPFFICVISSVSPFQLFHPNKGTECPEEKGKKREIYIYIYIYIHVIIF